MGCKILLLSVSLTGLIGCSSYRVGENDPDSRRILHRDVETTLARFRDEDPAMRRFFDSAWGYAVLPTIGKGGFLIGGARGHGEVFERGRNEQPTFVGYVTLTQGTIGAQAGGQTYSEVIFFQNRAAFK